MLPKVTLEYLEKIAPTAELQQIKSLCAKVREDKHSYTDEEYRMVLLLLNTRLVELLKKAKDPWRFSS